MLQITLSGHAFIDKLSKKEKEQFLKGEFVEQKSFRNGHRSYASYDPEKFVRELLGQHEVLEHISGKINNGIGTQDIWIIRKK